MTHDPAAITAERSPAAAVGRELLRRHGSVEDFADKIPMCLMAERLGVPREMAPQMRDRARDPRLSHPSLADTSAEVTMDNLLGSSCSLLIEMRRIVGDDRLDLDSDLLSSGADSLKLVEIAETLSVHLGRDVHINDIWTAPTLRALLAGRAPTPQVSGDAPTTPDV